jgi:hypothetical protein
MFGVAGTLEGEQDIRYENLRVEGYGVGIHVPEAGHHTIVGGYWNNARSIFVPTQMQRGRTLDITGDVKFGDAGTTKLGGEPQYDIYMAGAFAPLLAGRDANVLFAPDVTRIDVPGIAGKQLYYPEQAADAVPFKVAGASAFDRKRMGNVASLPAELIGKTAAELARQYGLAVAGVTAPPDARTTTRIHGLIGGAAAPYPAELAPATLRTPKLEGYQLTAIERGRKGGPVADAKPVDLKPGWNLITTSVDGVDRSFLVFGGEVKGYVQKKGKY